MGVFSFAAVVLSRSLAVACNSVTSVAGVLAQLLPPPPPSAPPNFYSSPELERSCARYCVRETPLDIVVCKTFNILWDEGLSACTLERKPRVRL